MLNKLASSIRIGSPYDPWAGKTRYTGALRPQYPLSPKRSIPDHIQKPDYALDGTVKRMFRPFQEAL